MARAKRIGRKVPTVFVVQWRGNSILERVFTSRAAAEAHCRELNRSGRGWANPFEWSGGPKATCSAGVPSLRRSLKKLGIPTPKRGQDWSEWWESVRPGMTAEQCEAVWDLLDNFRAFVIVKVPLED